MTNFEKVREFHEAFGLPNNFEPVVPDEKLRELRMRLLFEELAELEDEMYSDQDRGIELDFSKIAKELADVLYVTYGAAAALGINLDKAFDEVHRSNMSKLDNDGKPMYREDGKVLKGPNYRPPDMSMFAV